MDKKSEQSSSTSSAAAQALALPEILEHISTFLPRQDLLNCRLVNKQWNIEARKIVTKKIPIKFNREVWTFNNSRLREQFLELMTPHPSSRGRGPPPLFSNFFINNFRSLQSQLFTQISGSIKRLTFECMGTNQSRALDLILLSCPNLERLDFATRFDPVIAWVTLHFPEEHDFIATTLKSTMQIISSTKKFNKLKSLTLKLASINSNFDEEYYKLLSNLLARAPYLEELSFPSFVGQPIWMPEPILRSILEQLPHLAYLRYLCIDYQLTSPRQHTQQLLAQKFKLTKLRLNETCLEILDVILAYQPRVVSAQLSIRNFGWNDLLYLNGQPQRYCLRELRVGLVDFRNVHHGNQFQLKIGASGENFVAIIDELQSCVNTSRFFQLNTQNYLIVQPNMLYTVRAINICNVPANLRTVEFLAEFHGLTKLNILPTFPAVYRSIWNHLPGLEELTLHVHPNLVTYVYLEHAITGLSNPACYHLAHSDPGLGSEAELMALVQKKRNERALICICQLRRLRSLEIINTCFKPMFLTQTSIFTCFLKMNSLACLKFPYQGTSIPLRYLQLKSPSMYLDASEPS